MPQSANNGVDSCSSDDKLIGFTTQLINLDWQMMFLINYLSLIIFGQIPCPTDTLANV
jgi:hypothetical protein